jgi:eukaryotic-like serine/threonine-protein kinase
MTGELHWIRSASTEKRMPRIRQRLGKYRIDRVVGEGGYAIVYGARDTIEGIPVALKVFRPGIMGVETTQMFQQEARLQAPLDHQNILLIKDANVIDGHLVIVTRLGEGTLATRLAKRMSVRTGLHFAEEMLAGLAHAHESRVIHLDVKPENFILFPDDQLKLTDFGIARFARRTVRGSGSGTLGYTAPEQAMGRPSYRSDVFSVGLILWRMFGGRVPEWPFEWPPHGYDKIKKTLHRDFIAFLRRAIEFAPGDRFSNCSVMLEAFEKVAPKALRSDAARRGRRRNAKTSTNVKHWRQVRFKQFQREHRKSLDARHTCSACNGPVSESMPHCPWCSESLAVHGGDSRLSRRCERCERGMKPDWRYCAFCYGKGQEPKTSRECDDARYEARCTNGRCSRKKLMPFMRYCPWCRTKVQRKWQIAQSKHRCGSCGWGVLREYWKHCPWCSKTLRQ